MKTGFLPHSSPPLAGEIREGGAGREDFLNGLLAGIPLFWRSARFAVLALAIALAAVARVRADDTNPPLTIFHADSLTGYIAALSRRFEATHRATEVRHVGVGSLDAIRRVTDLHLPCDIVITADWRLLETPRPEFEPWVMVFAGNSLGIVYTSHSSGAQEIDAGNWYRILTRPAVRFGHSNPERDPAGYWTLVMWQLAEGYYHSPGLAARLQSACPARNIRPKSIDLIPLLQSGDLDYYFGYASDARLGGLSFLQLPAEINLGDFTRASQYAAAIVEVGTGVNKRRIQGAPIAYGATLTSAPPNRAAAIEFLKLVAGSAGREAAAQSGLVAYPAAFAIDAANRMPRELREVTRPFKPR